MEMMMSEPENKPSQSEQQIIDAAVIQKISTAIGIRAPHLNDQEREEFVKFATSPEFVDIMRGLFTPSSAREELAGAYRGAPSPVGSSSYTFNSELATKLGKDGVQREDFVPIEYELSADYVRKNSHNPYEKQGKDLIASVDGVGIQLLKDGTVTVNVIDERNSLYVVARDEKGGRLHINADRVIDGVETPIDQAAGIQPIAKELIKAVKDAFADKNFSPEEADHIRELAIQATPAPTASKDTGRTTT